MPVITAALSSDTIATSCGLAVHTGSPVLALCRRLIEEGAASSAPLQAYSGDVLALRVRSIGEAAGLEIHGGRFMQPRNRATASSMSQNESEAAK